MPNQTQILAAIAAQDAVNALLSTWADYAEEGSTDNVPVAVVRAAVGASDAALGLIR